MSFFTKCRCSWCTHSKCKLLSYVQCKTCYATNFNERISRIEISVQKTAYTCGFLCSCCFRVIQERYVEESTPMYPISLKMCKCLFCSEWKNVYRVDQYCTTCNKIRNMKRIKRIDKTQPSILTRCGWLCESCSAFSF